MVCYDAGTGAEVWAHEDSGASSRRWAEPVRGPRPRSTGASIYAQGAAGKLNCLDAATGRVIWSRDIREDSGAKLPMWGFSASPLVVQGIVTVFAGGHERQERPWLRRRHRRPGLGRGKDTVSYCSTQRVRWAASSSC